MTIPLVLRRGPTYHVPSVFVGNLGNQYELQEYIATGGNAVVYSAMDITNDQEVAIKFQLDLRANRLLRFDQEITLLKRHPHAHVMAIRDHGWVSAKKKRSSEQDIPFIVMPRARTNLAQRVKNGKVPFPEYFPQFRGLAGALANLHQEAAHRDIKPENILILGDTWVLSDFGLCTYVDHEREITEIGEIVGPRFWMSPEAINQMYGQPDVPSCVSDVYQLCSVFWFAVTQRHPTGILKYSDWGKEPKSLFRLLRAGLSHNPVQRPKDGQALKDKLQELEDRL